MSKLYNIDFARRSMYRLRELGASPEELRRFLDGLARNGHIDWVDNLQLRLELAEKEGKK